jgi:beta-barrel assembly-enhancing protease
MLKKSVFSIFTICVIVSFCGCETVKDTASNINVFPIDQDKQLGLQVSKQIESDTKQFPILPEKGNEQIYKYIREIRDNILNSGQVKYKDEFAWEVKIIDDSKTLNAFATPGGYIYVYTGLIKYLDSEDHLAGVMGHEIAHADLRHSTRQLTKMYGVQALVDIALGKAGMVKDVAAALVNLQFSRGHESESDAASVRYMCPTKYNAAGAAGFFEKIEAEGSAQPPQFLSTHPNPANRVQAIKAKKTELACGGNDTYKSRYEQMKRLLP